MEYALTMRVTGASAVSCPLPRMGTVRIGREAPADLVVPDPFLSRLHMSLECREGVFTLTDAGSRNGTLVNGVVLPQSELRHGDLLFAGSTSFRLSAMPDGKIVAPLLSGEATELLPWQGKLVERLQAEYRFALVDGAVDPRVGQMLQQYGGHFQSLYEGPPAAVLAPFGPYLLDLASNPWLLPRLIELGWGRSWGVFVQTAVGFEALRRHLRRSLVVGTEGGGQLLFRFYDPRVLGTFCAPADLRSEWSFSARSTVS